MEQTIFIVDDDSELRDLLGCLVESIGLPVELYESAEEFLESYNDRAGCLLVDVRLKGMSGLKLQAMLRSKNDEIPIIFLTANGDVPMAVRAMKEGAVDFFTKPFNNQLLLEAIQTAVDKNKFVLQDCLEREQVMQAYSILTKREREILQFIIAGKLSKEIAYDLKISLSTVEAHRAKIMTKMKVRSLALLVSMIMKNNVLK